MGYEREGTFMNPRTPIYTGLFAVVVVSGLLVYDIMHGNTSTVVLLTRVISVVVVSTTFGVTIGIPLGKKLSRRPHEQ